MFDMMPTWGWLTRLVRETNGTMDEMMEQALQKWITEGDWEPWTEEQMEAHERATEAAMERWNWYAASGGYW